MKHGRIYRDNDQALILDKVMLTTTALERMRGLLGRNELTDSEGLLIKPCSSIHTIGMSYPIDVIFITRDWIISKIVHNIGHFRMAWCRQSHMVLEANTNCIARCDLEPGNVLRWEEV